jgi:hypothetical protein
MSKLMNKRAQIQPSSTPSKNYVEENIKVNTNKTLADSEVDSKKDLSDQIKKLELQLLETQQSVDSAQEKTIQALETAHQFKQKNSELIQQLESYKDGEGNTILLLPKSDPRVKLHPKNKELYGEEFDEKLYESFIENGQMSPGSVARNQLGEYVIVAGTTRWNLLHNDKANREFEALNPGQQLTHFKAIDLGVMTDEEMLHHIINANIQRDKAVWMVISEAAEERDILTAKAKTKTLANLKKGKKNEDSQNSDTREKGERVMDVIGRTFFKCNRNKAMNILKIYDLVKGKCSETGDDWRAHKAIKSLGSDPYKLKNDEEILLSLESTKAKPIRQLRWDKEIRDEIAVKTARAYEYPEIDANDCDLQELKELAVYHRMMYDKFKRFIDLKR